MSKDCCQNQGKNTATKLFSPSLLKTGPENTTLTVALLGNPNTGKSTLFNALTGSHQTVRNAPGTTVEVFSGTIERGLLRIIDMPGTYSLLPNSPDEAVVTDAIAVKTGSITEALTTSTKGKRSAVDSCSCGQGEEAISPLDARIDLILCVIDATSIERSLYLVGQAAQTGLPVMCALTMLDIASENGEQVDVLALTKTLGVPVLGLDPRRVKGLDALRAAMHDAIENRPYVKGLPVDPNAPGYNEAAGQNLRLRADAGETGLPEIQENQLDEYERAAVIFDWVTAVEDRMRQISAEVSGGVEASGEATGTGTGTNTDTTTDAATGSGQKREKTATATATSALPKFSKSDRIDRVLLHPLIGVLVFMVAMYIVFWLANTFAAVFQDPVEGLFHNGWELTIPAGLFSVPFTHIGWPADDIALAAGPSLGDGLAWLLNAIGLGDGIIQGLLVDGVLAGMGVVASFAPLMIVMFLAIGFLEDSGYMARVAFLGDRLMRVVGLDGRVILPFVVGFGCNLPTLAALRTIPDTRQRIMSVILTPYVTCSARMIIYIFIARIFFPEHTATVVWLMYFASIVMVFLGGLVLRPIIMRRARRAPLMLVLPAYQTPRALVMLRAAGARTWSFLKGAGKVIVVMNVVIWLLLVTPVRGEASFGDSMPASDSAYGAVATAIAPVFDPAGFGSWQVAGSLMTGFVAKETLLSSLAISYNVPEDTATALDDGADPDVSTAQKVREGLETSAGGPAAAVLAAIALLIFVLTYTPCLATVAEQWRQIGRWRTLAAVGVQLTVAWALAVAIFQIGRLFI